MTPVKSPALIAGPYHSPKVKIGSLYMGHAIRSRLAELVPGPHVVAGFSGGRIPWPVARLSPNGNRQLLIGGDLEQAIRTESVLAVQYYWGVSRTWVERARRVFGVQRMNPGTTALWRTLLPGRMPVRGGPKRKGPWRHINLAQARVIRRRVKAGETRIALAAEFGLTRHHVGRIVAGRRWVDD